MPAKLVTNSLKNRSRLTNSFKETTTKETKMRKREEDDFNQKKNHGHHKQFLGLEPSVVRLFLNFCFVLPPQVICCCCIRLQEDSFTGLTQKSQSDSKEVKEREG